MNIRSKVKGQRSRLGLGLGLGLGDRVAGVSNAPLSSAPLVSHCIQQTETVILSYIIYLKFMFLIEQKICVLLAQCLCNITPYNYVDRTRCFVASLDVKMTQSSFHDWRWRRTFSDSVDRKHSRHVFTDAVKSPCRPTFYVSRYRCSVVACIQYCLGRRRLRRLLLLLLRSGIMKMSIKTKVGQKQY